MSIKLYDKVRLSNGRTATIVDILDDGGEYIVDVDVAEEKRETIEISIDNIDAFV